MNKIVKLEILSVERQGDYIYVTVKGGTISFYPRLVPKPLDTLTENYLIEETCIQESGDSMHQVTYNFVKREGV